MVGRGRDGAATRERIIVTAERLFGQNGIDGVSIRDIAAAAKVNSAATHYHFGTKADLIEAILRIRAAQAYERTNRILTALEGTRPTVRQIVEALVRPTAETGKNYAAFLVAISDHPGYAELAHDVFETPSRTLLELFMRAAPDLPPEIAAFRFATVQVVVNQALGKRRPRISYWIHQLHPDGHVDYVEALIDLLTGALAAPVNAGIVPAHASAN